MATVLLTTAEVGRLLGVTREAVRQWVRTRRIEPQFCASNGFHLFTAEDVQRLRKLRGSRQRFPAQEPR